MSEINQKIAQLTGLTSSFVSDIKNNLELKENDKYFLYRDLVQAVAVADKEMSIIKKKLDEYSKKSLRDGETIIFNGYELTLKIAKAGVEIDVDKLEKDFKRILGDYNLEYKKSDYEIDRTPRKTVTVQKPLNYNQN